jgi:hypothetical protein
LHSVDELLPESQAEDHAIGVNSKRVLLVKSFSIRLHLEEFWLQETHDIVDCLMSKERTHPLVEQFVTAGNHFGEEDPVVVEIRIFGAHEDQVFTLSP